MIVKVGPLTPITGRVPVLGMGRKSRRGQGQNSMVSGKMYTTLILGEGMAELGIPCRDSARIGEYSDGYVALTLIAASTFLWAPSESARFPSAYAAKDFIDSRKFVDFGAKRAVS